MKLAMTMGVLLLLSGAAAADPSLAAAKTRTVVGTIKDYACQDFCHLTVVDARGKKHSALCGAPLCVPWANAGVMPRRFLGRKVRATVTKDSVEYEGKTMQLDAFTKIELLR